MKTSVQPEVHSALRVVLAATRALLDQDAGLSGAARELAESAGRNAERMARLLDRTSAPQTRGLVDVRQALGMPADGGGEPVWAVVDVDALRRGIADLSDAARSQEAVSVRPGTDGRVQIVVELPGLLSPLPAEPAGWTRRG